MSSRNRRRKTAREKRPLAGETGVEAGEVEGEKFYALAQSAAQSVEARRHVVGLADEEDLMGGVGLGVDKRGDGAHRRRKERTVRREAIGGAQIEPFHFHECAGQPVYR